MHRDIKPENILIDSIEDNCIKLTDFGFASFFKEKEKLKEVMGSPLYMAPELVSNQEYDSKVDVWSSGVVAFTMLCGKPPFFGKNKEEVYSCIKFQKLEEAYPREIEKVISNKAKDFLSKVLCKDPEKRLSAIDALQHPWLVNLESSDVSVSDKELGGVV